jgi:hypothetical protein
MIRRMGKMNFATVNDGTDRFQLTFAEIEAIALVPLDHSFLRYQKELEEYGFRVEKISIKEQTVTARREA